MTYQKMSNSPTDPKQIYLFIKLDSGTRIFLDKVLGISFLTNKRLHMHEKCFGSFYGGFSDRL